MIMMRWNRLAIAWMASAALVLAQGGDKAAEAVKQAEKDWAEAITKKDPAKLEKLLADDLVYTHSTGSTDTKAIYISNIKSGKQDYVAVDYEEMKVRVYGNAAVVNAQAQVKSMTEGKQTGSHLKFTHVFIKGKGGWQLVSHQSTRLAN